MSSFLQIGPIAASITLAHRVLTCLDPDLFIEPYCSLLIFHIFHETSIFLSIWYVLGPGLSAKDKSINQIYMVPYFMKLILELTHFFVQARVTSFSPWKPTTLSNVNIPKTI
jgi:hypothetical protein